MDLYCKNCKHKITRSPLKEAKIEELSSVEETELLAEDNYIKVNKVGVVFSVPMEYLIHTKSLHLKDYIASNTFTGCCGPSQFDKINQVCPKCSAEIGILIADCWTSKFIAVDINKVIEKTSIVEESNDLDLTVEKLYKVFSSYSIKRDIRARSCECCVSDEEIEVLLSMPLRKISVDEISHFMKSAISTYGSIDDYKHFLPRILELMMFSENIIYDFLTYEKLEYVNWKSWKEDERLVIECFFKELMISKLNKKSISFLNEVTTICIKYLGIEVVLQHWEKNISDTLLNLIVASELGAIDLSFNEADSFVFNTWLQQSFIMEKLEDLFLRATDTIDANRISIVYTNLDNKRN